MERLNVWMHGALEIGKNYQIDLEGGTSLLGTYEGILDDNLVFKLGARRIYINPEKIEQVKEIDLNLEALDEQTKQEILQQARKMYYREYQRKYYAQHKEKILARNREYLRRYRKEHPEKVKEARERYWIRKALQWGLDKEDGKE
jgi:hypothetical protein